MLYVCAEERESEREQQKETEQRMRGGEEEWLMLTMDRA